MNCPKCNSIIEQGESFCKMCGSNLNQTIPQKNQEIKDITQNSTNEESVKTNIIKYLKKCYIPFAIIFCIYMVANSNIEQCYNDTTDSTLPCTFMYLFNEGFFLITNFAIVLPFIGVSTNKLLKKFNTNESKIKITDLIVMILTSITTVFLASKIGILAFLFIPIVVLFYFSGDNISKKTSQIIYFVLILSSFIPCFIVDYVFYKIIITYNIVIIPTVSIIFYLSNLNKIKFKIQKFIPVVLVLVILILSLYQSALKYKTSFTEIVKKENINFEFEDIYDIEKIVYADNENIYMIADSDYYYEEDQIKDCLSKYNISTHNFEPLFVDVKNTLFANELLFFQKGNSIYMLNTKNGEVIEIIDERYKVDTDDDMYYNDGNLYFSSKDNIVYSYNIDTSDIKTFKVDRKEDVIVISEDIIFTATQEWTSSYYSYDFNGNKVELSYLPQIFGVHPYEGLIHQDYLYYIDDGGNYISGRAGDIIINNLKKKESYTYVINPKDIYNEVTDQIVFENMGGAEILGVYDNKVYFKIFYHLKYTDTNFYERYDNIYYLEIKDFVDDTTIKINAISEPFKEDEIDAYLLDKYIYVKDTIGNFYKYDLENNIKTLEHNIDVSVSSWISFEDYIYLLNQGGDAIYRISKNNFQIENILKID